MSFFNRNNKITVRNDTFASTELMQRNIVRAIASIFLHLVRVDPKRTNQQRLHYLLNNLHRNFFQANRPYDELEQAIHNLMPIPDAVRIIQHEFSYAEKLIFLLQIIQLVFQEPEFNVLESLEIVELIDDLYIKLKDYDAMLDFVEGDTEHLCLCPALLLTDKITAFYNCLKLSPQPDADVKLADSFSEMLLIRLDESILVVSGSQQKLKINSQSVTEEIILSLKSGDTCEITSDKDNQQFCLDFEQIKVLFKNKLQNTRKSFNLQTETGLLRMMQTDNKLYCHSQTGRISIKNGIVYSKHQTELHLTDSFQTGNQSVTMLDILTERFSPSVTDATEKLFYLEKSDDVYTLSTSRNAHSLLSLQYKERNWYATPLNPFRKVFLNHILLSDSTVYQTGTDILDIDNDSLVINPSLEVTNTAKEIYNIEVKDIFHTYPDSDKHALNHIQFSLKRGDILAIMGPSGSGKTTLLKTFLGELHPKKAEIIIDGQDFISNREYFHSRIAYVPQDDLLFTNLTVYENLYYCVRLRLSGRYSKTALQ
ncbi:MAG: ATP-binding cassette domain-containing protein, partial [Candidatus Cloacimonetes bacterium]|nr:ATP-binding cassette domain-containing protein [Candidatus Cloacimonadota bacterium]